jgi:thiosulfate dehydrogenase (quinone) large subunit
MNKNLKAALFLLRVFLGILFLYAGVDKLLNNFMPEPYLLYATTGPFRSFFVSLVGTFPVYFFVVYGEIAIGLALIFGAFLRLASYFGIVMMALFYLSVLPAEHGPVSDLIIYIFVFIVLIFSQSGSYLGLDRFIQNIKFVKKNWKVFKFLLG